MEQGLHGRRCGKARFLSPASKVNGLGDRIMAPVERIGDRLLESDSYFFSREGDVRFSNFEAALESTEQSPGRGLAIAKRRGWVAFADPRGTLRASKGLIDIECISRT